MAIAKDTGIPLMPRIAHRVARRLYAILNAMKKRVSNGNTESLNSKIRLLRDKERFRLGVMFHYGKLNINF
jgi:transposase